MDESKKKDRYEDAKKFVRCNAANPTQIKNP